jgi:hypothetical protein
MALRGADSRKAWYVVGMSSALGGDHVQPRQCGRRFGGDTQIENVMRAYVIQAVSSPHPLLPENGERG